MSGEESSHVVTGLNAFLFVSILCFCLFASYLIKKYNITFLPESGAAMIIGMGVGSCVLLFSKEESEKVMFEPETFFFVLLPPIIFEAGFSMKKKSFFSNFTSITMFAVLGTVISTFMIGYLLFVLAKAGAVPLDQESPLESLMFGALISAVDPVATLSILGSDQVNADPTLYALVFGESVLNDAVSIVLFNTLKGFHAANDGFKDTDVLVVMGEFIGVSIGSVLLGCTIALASALLFKRSNLYKYPDYELTLLFFFAYSSYCLAEIIELSGIMALFFCGVLMSHYTWYNMSRSSKVTTKHAFKGIALISETFLFAYLGLTAIISFRPVFGLHWDAQLILLSLPLCFISRAFNIFPISNLVNCRRKTKITGRMQILMWFAGLRGAIAFALSLNVPMSMPGRPYIVTTTMTIVIFTTLVCGGYTERLMDKLNLKNTAEHTESLLENDDVNSAIQNSNLDIEEREGLRGIANIHRAGGLHQAWKTFDQRYMKPIFGGKGHVVDEDNHAANIVHPSEGHGDPSSL